jgi:predicted nucleotidyltransferase
MSSTIQIETSSKETDRGIIKAALSELQAALRKKYRQNTPIVLVYGSQARHEANATSDIDVLLLYTKTVHPGQEIQRLSPVLADLNLRYQVLISILPASESDYRDSTSAFWENVRREGLPIDAL